MKKAVILAFLANLPSSLYAFDQSLNELEVFTPSLMAQSVADSPGSVTVITADDIERLSIKTVPDILRLVPGFAVGYSSPIAGVNRGSVDNNPRRLQVLVDGVSEVNPLVGIVNWETLPAPVDAIERIEVVRSQSSSAHGANAFVGTINIITKSPAESQSLSATAWATDRGGEAYIADGTKVASTYVSGYLNRNRYDRFDTYTDGVTERNDTQDYYKAGLRTSTQTSAGTFNTKIAGSTGDFEHDVGKTTFGVTYPVADIDTLLLNTSFVQTAGDHVITYSAYRNWRDWNYHWLVRAPKAFFYPDLGLLFRDNEELVLAAVSGKPAPASATPEQLARLQQIFGTLLSDPTSFQQIQGDTNVDYRYESRQYAVNDVWTATDTLRISSSFQIDQRRFLSETYGNGVTRLNKSRVFSNAEYKPTERWTVNLGAMAESIGYSLDQPEFSPRLGLNYHLSTHTTIKSQYAVGKRLIDGIELLEHNQVPTHFPFEVYGSTRQTGFYGYFDIYQNPDLVEGIESSELAILQDLEHVSWDARVYKERMYDLLNIRLASTGDGRDTFSGNSRGAEFNSRLTFERKVLGFGGHYLEATATSDIGYNDYHRYGGHAFATLPLNPRSDLTIAYYGTSGVVYSGFDRVDVFATQRYQPAGDDIVLQYGVSHHREELTNTYNYMILDGGIQEQNEFFVRAKWTPSQL